MKSELLSSSDSARVVIQLYPTNSLPPATDTEQETTLNTVSSLCDSASMGASNHHTSRAVDSGLIVTWITYAALIIQARSCTDATGASPST